MDVIDMTREEKINKAFEELLDKSGICLSERPTLRMWYKMGAKFADGHPIDEIDWKLVRVLASVFLMGAMTSCTDYSGTDEDYARWAVSRADALVKELKGEEP